MINYSVHLNKISRPEEAPLFYAPFREQFKHNLAQYDQHYDKYKKDFWINSNGTLSYYKLKALKVSQRAKKLAQNLQSYIPPVSIFDILIDCNNLTGFMDSFRPLTGRQNMNEEDRILGVLTSLYAYGCNCGPSQAAQATGLTKQMVLYMRRHYTGEKQLIEAASALVDAYSCTKLAHQLNTSGIFMTDAMRFPTLKDSLTARHHFRYSGGKSILLYQHIT